MSQPQIEVFDTIGTIFKRATEILIQRYRQAVDEFGVLTLGLSGGRTPQPLYASWSEPGFPVNWKNVELFMVDERHVPHDHPDSNWGMIRKSLVDHVPIPEKQCHPIQYAGNAKQSADWYHQELSDVFHLKPDHFPSLDILFMGLGTDGHTASLFPGTPALNPTDRLAVDVYHEYAMHARVSMTFPVLHRADLLLFIVRGKDKAQRIYDILIRKDGAFPATVACRGTGQMIFLLDREAAGML